MLSATKETAITIAKFRGCLVGSLLGDCLGAPFEGDATVTKIVLQNYFDKLENQNFKTPQKMYTDDTTLMKGLAESLIEHKCLKEVELAKRFTKDYFDNPRRGFGAHIGDVFVHLRRSQFEDVWAPASLQFGGSGSYGNGAAMRIAPVALFSHSNYAEMISIGSKSSRLTHTNRLGVNGALLQCIAVNMGLKMDPNKPVDSNEFMKELMEKMEDIEKEGVVMEEDERRAYGKQLKVMKNLLAEDPSDFHEEVVNILGHSTAALYSVPTAVYCFLRGQKPVPQVETNNPFRRVIQLAISLGGDTDTIACMAGAISGAYHGIDHINQSLQNHCEGLPNIIDIADNLYKVST